MSTHSAITEGWWSHDAQPPIPSEWVEGQALAVVAATTAWAAGEPAVASPAAASPSGAWCSSAITLMLAIGWLPAIG